MSDGFDEYMTKMPPVTLPTSKEWNEVVVEVTADLNDLGDAVLDDDAATTKELRECILRTRLAAAAERQAHLSRACVADVVMETVGGKPRTRFTVASPVGDRLEMRAMAIDIMAAWLWALRHRPKAEE